MKISDLLRGSLAPLGGPPGGPIGPSLKTSALTDLFFQLTLGTPREAKGFGGLSSWLGGNNLLKATAVLNFGSCNFAIFS